MITMPLEVYTDGSCLNNPGAGGYAFLVRYYTAQGDDDMPEAKVIEQKQGYRLTTNNRMEILAGIKAIQFVMERTQDGTLAGATQINLFSDSEYFCNSVNRHWIDKWQQNNWMTSGFQGRPAKPVRNKDLWELFLQTQKQLQAMNLTLSISHVKGHDGNEHNERADQLAVEASHDGNNHLIDEVYEKTTTVYNKR